MTTCAHCNQLLSGEIWSGPKGDMHKACTEAWLSEVLSVPSPEPVTLTARYVDASADSGDDRQNESEEGHRK